MPVAIATCPAAQDAAPAVSLSTPFRRSCSLLFIDPGVENWHGLAEAALPGTEVHVLEGDAIAQITSVLANRSDVKAVHIVSHGSSGCLYLGEQELSLKTLDRHTHSLQTWFESQVSTVNAECSTPRPALVLYGCNVAVGDAGEAFLDRLHQLMCVNIAASTGLTGASERGGDWELAARGGCG